MYYQYFKSRTKDRWFFHFGQADYYVRARLTPIDYFNVNLLGEWVP